MIRLLSIAALLSAGLAAGCAPGPQQIEDRGPTVSYSYDTLREARQARYRAADHCLEHYGREAELIDDDRIGNENVMTFECVAQ